MISIIVPAYNVENYIAKTLDSILNQTEKDIEIIVVDDGSTDNTFKIIDAYAQRYPRTIRGFCKVNEGVTCARLYGVTKARGEYVGFVDSDDTIEADMYELLLKNMQKFDADISHCGYKMIFVDGRINEFYNSGRVMVCDQYQGLDALLKGQIVEPGLWNKLYKKNLLKKMIEDSKMDYSICINEDLLMNFYLFMYAEKSVFEDKCKYNYVVRTNSATRDRLSSHRIFDPIKVKAIIMECSPKELKETSETMYIRTCVSTYNTLCVNGIRNYLEEVKRVKKIIRKDRNCCKEKRDKILTLLICFLPAFVYKLIYCFYAKYILKNPYE